LRVLLHPSPSRALPSSASRPAALVVLALGSRDKSEAEPSDRSVKPGRAGVHSPALVVTVLSLENHLGLEIESPPLPDPN
jgi:hypothetical protein